MRTLPILILAVLLLVLAGWAPVSAPRAHADEPASPQLVQDNDGEVIEADARMLRRYLNATGEDREKLRAALLSLSPERRLENAIEALPFEPADATGTIRMDIPCPDGFTRPCWVWLPDGYDPGTRYKVIISLHGGVSGAPAERIGDTVPRWPAVFEVTGTKDTIVIVPAAAVPSSNQDARWWRNAGQLNILAMLRHVKLRYRIDDERVFVTGHSDGGSGSFSLAARRPDAFAGFFPMCGHPGVPASDTVGVWFENFQGQNIYAINGGADRLYPGMEVEKMINEINAAGPNIRFRLYAQAGHDLSFLGEEGPKIVNTMMKEWTRNLLPERIDWSSDDAERGRRAWISIDGISESDSTDATVLPEGTQFNLGPRTPRLGVQIDPQAADGVPVTVVMPDTPAAASGIEAGDIIRKMNGTEVKNLDDLRAVLAQAKFGDDFELVVERAGEMVTIKGHFPAPVETHSARLIAERTKGAVSVSSRNLTKLSVWVTREMLDADGRLKVTVDGREVFNGKVELDRELILSEFERTGDRHLPFIARVSIDLAAPQTEPQREPQRLDEEEDF